jgi:hypothetical protein
MFLRKKKKVVLTYEMEKPWKWVTNYSHEARVRYLNA